MQPARVRHWFADRNLSPLPAVPQGPGHCHHGQVVLKWPPRAGQQLPRSRIHQPGYAARGATAVAPPFAAAVACHHPTPAVPLPPPAFPACSQRCRVLLPGRLRLLPASHDDAAPARAVARPQGRRRSGQGRRHHCAGHSPQVGGMHAMGQGCRWPGCRWPGTLVSGSPSFTASFPTRSPPPPPLPQHLPRCWLLWSGAVRRLHELQPAGE